MLRGEVSYGYAIGLGSIVAAEALANCGIDHILLDRQHGSWGEESTIAALIAMHGGTAIPMARVSRNDYTMIGRLDEGCMGIIVPMVHTAEDAKAADACRLPRLAPDRGAGVGQHLRRGLPGHRRRPDLRRRPDREPAGRRERRGDHGDPGVDGCWTERRHGALDGRRSAQGRRERRARPALEKIVQACKNTGKIPHRGRRHRGRQAPGGAGVPVHHLRQRRRLHDGGARAGLQALGLTK